MSNVAIFCTYSKCTEKQEIEIYEMQRGRIKTLNEELGTLTFSLDLSKKRNHQELLDEFYALQGVEYVKEIA